MCLAVPGKYIESTSCEDTLQTGKVAFAGVQKDICFALLPDAAVGDYVLVHAGFAIAVIDEKQARESLDLLDAMTLQEHEQPDQ